MKARNLIHVLLLLTFVSATQAERPHTRSTSGSSQSGSTIQVELAPDVRGASRPSAELVLVDPQERKTGLDNNGQTGRDKPWLEIPNSSYAEVAIGKSQQFKRVITVREPMQGNYWLGVYGHGQSDAVYQLTVRLQHGDKAILESSYRVRLSALSVDTYLVRYSEGQLRVHSDRAGVGDSRR